MKTKTQIKTPTKTKLNHIKKAKTVVKTPSTPIETSNDKQQTSQQPTSQQQNTSNSNNIIDRWIFCIGHIFCQQYQSN